MDRIQKLKQKQHQEEIPKELSLSGFETFKDEGFTFRRPMHVCFKHITYTLDTRRATAKILKNVSGFVNPGQILAIMGPSGCGKSTLMNILSGRISEDKWDGLVLVNGNMVSSHVCKQNFGFVTQDDSFLASLTVREQLLYSAMLRLPKNITMTQKRNKVEEVLASLGLTNCANTRIGNDVQRGVSGGERKRTNIGVELLCDPSVLFLDEPTSGLDAYTAKKLMDTLRLLADEGRTIIVSLHQPRIDIFNQVDYVLLMSAGETCYFGPGNEAIVDYMAQNNIEIGRDANPADIMMDAVTEGNVTRVARTRILKKKKVSKPVVRERALSLPTLNIFADDRPRECAADLLAEAHEKTPLGNPMNFPPPPDFCSVVTGSRADIHRPGKQEQFLLLYKRACTNFYRNRMATVARFIIACVLGLICGSVFLKTSYSPSGVTDKSGLVFVAMMACSISVANNVVAVFPAERAVFLREYKSGSYKIGPYFIAKVLAELPMQLLTPLVQGTIAYWMADMNNDGDRFGVFVATLMAIALTSTMIGLTISCSVSSSYLASVLTSPIMTLFLLLAGFLRVEENLPAFWDRLKFVSFYRYAYVLLMCNEFKGQQFECVDGTCLAHDGSTYLKYILGFDCSQQVKYYFNIVGFYLGFMVIGFTVLYLKTKRS